MAWRVETDVPSTGIIYDTSELVSRPHGLAVGLSLPVSGAIQWTGLVWLRTPLGGPGWVGTTRSSGRWPGRGLPPTLLHMPNSLGKQPWPELQRELRKGWAGAEGGPRGSQAWVAQGANVYSHHDTLQTFPCPSSQRICTLT